MDEVPRDEGFFRHASWKGKKFMKLEFFNFPHVTERIVGSKDDSSKAETKR
jgi:hypothetical protein